GVLTRRLRGGAPSVGAGGRDVVVTGWPRAGLLDEGEDKADRALLLHRDRGGEERAGAEGHGRAFIRGPAQAAGRVRVLFEQQGQRDRRGLAGEEARDRGTLHRGRDLRLGDREEDDVADPRVEGAELVLVDARRGELALHPSLQLGGAFLDREVGVALE